jgi:hypothetical protein
LTGASLDARQRRREFITPLATAAIFLFSIGIAFIDPDWANLAWLLILPLTLLRNRYM